jgi:hypothetical protein
MEESVLRVATSNRWPEHHWKAVLDGESRPRGYTDRGLSEIEHSRRWKPLDCDSWTRWQPRRSPEAIPCLQRNVEHPASRCQSRRQGRSSAVKPGRSAMRRLAGLSHFQVAVCCRSKRWRRQPWHHCAFDARTEIRPMNLQTLKSHTWARRGAGWPLQRVLRSGRLGGWRCRHCSSTRPRRSPAKSSGARSPWALWTSSPGRWNSP